MTADTCSTTPIDHGNSGDLLDPHSDQPALRSTPYRAPYRHSAVPWISWVMPSSTLAKAYRLRPRPLARQSLRPHRQRPLPFPPWNHVRTSRAISSSVPRRSDSDAVPLMRVSRTSPGRLGRTLKRPAQGPTRQTPAYPTAHKVATPANRSRWCSRSRAPISAPSSSRRSLSHLLLVDNHSVGHRRGGERMGRPQRLGMRPRRNPTAGRTAQPVPRNVR